MGAGTPGSTPPPLSGGDSQPPAGCMGERRTPHRFRPGTRFLVPFPHRVGAREFLSYRPDGVVFGFASVGKESSQRRADTRRNEVACATPVAFWATVMERRENHHVPRDDFFGSTPAFPRVFLCIGRIDCFLASRREQNHPSRCRNTVDAMPSGPFSGGIASHSLWVWQDGRPNVTRFRFGCRFNPAACCHAASTHIGKENLTCLLAAEGIAQGFMHRNACLHATIPGSFVLPG